MYTDRDMTFIGINTKEEQTEHLNMPMQIASNPYSRILSKLETRPLRMPIPTKTPPSTVNNQNKQNMRHSQNTEDTQISKDKIQSNAKQSLNVRIQDALSLKQNVHSRINPFPKNEAFLLSKNNKNKHKQNAPLPANSNVLKQSLKHMKSLDFSRYLKQERKLCQPTVQHKQKTKYECILEEYCQKKLLTKDMGVYKSKQRQTSKRIQKKIRAASVTTTHKASFQKKQIFTQKTQILPAHSRSTQKIKNFQKVNRNEHLKSKQDFEIKNSMRKPLKSVRLRTECNSQSKKTRLTTERSSDHLKGWMQMDFHSRQQRILQSRRKCEQWGKQQRKLREIQGCTFRPQLNNNYRRLTPKQSECGYSQMYYQRLRSRI